MDSTLISCASRTTMHRLQQTLQQYRRKHARQRHLLKLASGHLGLTIASILLCVRFFEINPLAAGYWTLAGMNLACALWTLQCARSAL